MWPKRPHLWPVGLSLHGLISIAAAYSDEYDDRIREWSKHINEEKVFKWEFDSIVEHLTVVWPQEVMKWDMESQAMLAGAGLLVLMVLWGLCKWCCCRRRRQATDEEALSQVRLVVPVELQRASGGKLGLGIDSHPEGGFNITRIDDGLVSQWNQSQPDQVRRVVVGDRIVSVVSDGARHTTLDKMSDAFKNASVLVLGIAISRDPAVTGRITCLVNLEGLVLKDVVECAEPQQSYGGIVGAGAVEITKVLPGLGSWNDARRAEGSCRSQLVEVGDRIVSLNNLLDVRGNLGQPSPTLVLVKWAPGGVQTTSFDVTCDKKEGDRLGMGLQKHPSCSTHMQVNEVVEGALVSQWNKSNPGQAVQKGDRIVAVNGREGLDAIREELGKPQIRLTMQRWSAGDAPAVTQAPAPIFGAKAAMPASVGAVSAPLATPQRVAPAANIQKPAAPSSTPSGGPEGGWFSLCGVFLALALGLPVFAIAAAAAVSAAGGQLPGAAGHRRGVRLPRSTKLFMKQIHPELYVDLALPLMFVGGVLTVHFLYSEASRLTRPVERGLAMQLFTALVASVSLGYGIFFLLAWAGVYG